MKRAYAVTTAIDDYRQEVVHYGQSAAKVRYGVLLSARDAGFEISFKHIRLRSLGVRETPREKAEREAATFNRLYPIGTPIEVHPFLDSDDYAYCTRVIAPGAFVMASDTCAVKVPGDAFWIAAVFPILLLEAVA